MPQEVLDRARADEFCWREYEVVILDEMWREARHAFGVRELNELEWPVFWQRWKTERC